MGKKKDVPGPRDDVADDAGVRDAPMVRASESDNELDENALEAPPKPRRQRSEAQIAAFERMRAANKTKQSKAGGAPDTPKPVAAPTPKPARKKQPPAPELEPEPEPEPEPVARSRKQRSDKGRARSRYASTIRYSSAPIPIPTPHTRKVDLGHNLYSNFIIV